MYDSSTSSSPILQRHLSEREELFKGVLALPLEIRRDLVNKLIWSLPRNEITILSEQLIGILQRDIIGSLPPELAVLILAKLDFEDLLNCSLVCKKWRNIYEEQALWALLCASHHPPIRPTQPTWSELSSTRSILSQPKITHSEEDEEEEYDDRFGYGFFDPPAQIPSSNSSRKGLDPLGMKGGLRRNVWERGITSETLPTHLQFPPNSTSTSTLGVGNKIKEISPIPSHLHIPSNKPQVDFKHLYIINKIIEKRLITPRPLYNNNPYYNNNDPPTSISSSSSSKSLLIPKPKTIDAISSVKNGGLPGHSEAIYSLSLINFEMKINLDTNCLECNHPSIPTSSYTQSNSNQSILNSFSTFKPFSSPSPFNSRSNRDKNSNSQPLLPGQKMNIQNKLDFVQGKEWLLSGSRDKTLRLWLLSSNDSTEPRVVKIFQGGHSGSVLTHNVVKIPFKSKLDSPIKGVEKLDLNEKRLDLSGIKKNEKEKEKLVAVSGGSDGKICLWDLEGNSTLPVRIIQGHQDSVLCVRANEEYVVSCSKDKTIKLFDINTLEQKLVIGPTNGSEDDKLHRGAVNAVGLSKDYIISASGDKTLRIWSIQTGKLLHTLEAHSRGIASIDFSTSPTSCIPILEEGEIWKGSVVTGASDASIKIFHLVESDFSASELNSTPQERQNRQGVETREMMDLDQDSPSSSSSSSLHTNTNVIHQVPNENGKLVYLKEDKTMWAPCICPPGSNRPNEGHTASGTGCRRCGNRGHTELVRTVYMGEKIVISGSYDSKVKVWDRKTGQHLMDLSNSGSSSPHTGRIFSVVGNKYKLISTGLDSRINIWNFGYGLDTSFVEP